MQISNQYYITPNFKATKIATAYNYARGNTAIDIFKLSKRDITFLEKLSQKISIKELCPKLMRDVQERWQRVFDYCIQEAKEADNLTYIAVSEGVPCGILTYHEESSKNNFLDGISAIPSIYGKKTPLAGDTLLYQLYRDSSLGSSRKGIVLEAVHNGPVDVVKKYEEIGFTPITADENYTKMACNKFKVTEQINNFKRNIDYEEIEPEQVNLEEYID